MRGGWFRVPGSRECRRTLRGPIRSVRRGRPCAGPPNGRPPGSPLRWPVSRATTRVAPLWSETERHGVSRPLTVEVARVQQARRIRGFRAHRGPVGFALGEAESVIRMDESTRGRAPGSQRVVCAPDLCDMRLLGRQPESGPSLQRLFQEAGSANRSSLSLLRNSVAGCSARRIGDLLGLPRSTAPSPAVPMLAVVRGQVARPHSPLQVSVGEGPGLASLRLPVRVPSKALRRPRIQGSGSCPFSSRQDPCQRIRRRWADGPAPVQEVPCPRCKRPGQSPGHSSPVRFERPGQGSQPERCVSDEARRAVAGRQPAGPR